MYMYSSMWSIRIHNNPYSGHLEWHVGRCSVVVRCLMEDCHHWVYQNCWRMVREWKHRTMLLALCTCLQLPDCDVPVLAWQPWWEANILSATDKDQCCTLFNGWLPGVLRNCSMWWNRWGMHIAVLHKINGMQIWKECWPWEAWMAEVQPSV